METPAFSPGRQSRQDVSTLRQIAVRLGGVFHNGYEKHLATATIRVGQRSTAHLHVNCESALYIFKGHGTFMTGDRLDGLGVIVDVLRGGRGDDAYRLRIRAELAILKSKGVAAYKKGDYVTAKTYLGDAAACMVEMA